MVTVSWLQSDINALPKGFFLTHFVQLSPFSSGPDPKPIRSIEGFNSIQKAVYSVCNRNFQSTTDHGNLHADLNQVSALCNRENGAGICLFFFFLMNCTRLFVWGCVGPSFHFRRLPSFHCRSTSPPFSRPCSKMLGRSLRLPSQSLLEDLVTDSPNLWRKWPHVLSSPSPAADSTHPSQVWPVSMATAVPGWACLWSCHLLLLHLSSVRNWGTAP